MDLKKKILILTIILVLILSISTISYSLMLGWDIIDSFFFSLITITTIGYGIEVHQNYSVEWKIFTSILIISGIGVFLYTITNVMEVFLVGDIKKYIRRNKMEKEISKISNHYIICGYGRIGRLIAEQLAQRDEKFLIIENNPNAIAMIEKKNYLYIKGNATLDETLLKARIKEAKALVAVVKSDAHNIFITLSARGLNNNLLIISKYYNDSSIEKLMKAGANRVVSPYQIGGYKMTQILLSPNINDFLEFVSSGKNKELSLEEVVLHKNHKFINKTIINSRIKQDYGLIILAIKKKNGELLYNPSLDTVLEEQDILITFGNHEQIRLIS